MAFGCLGGACAILVILAWRAEREVDESPSGMSILFAAIFQIISDVDFAEQNGENGVVKHHDQSGDGEGV